MTEKEFIVCMECATMIVKELLVRKRNEHLIDFDYDDIVKTASKVTLNLREKLYNCNDK